MPAYCQPQHPPASLCVVQALRFTALASRLPEHAEQLRRLAQLCERLAYGRPVRGRPRTLVKACTRCESREARSDGALCKPCLRYMRQTSRARHAGQSVRRAAA
jgi:hypothetical protein